MLASSLDHRQPFDALRLLKALSLSKGTSPDRLDGRWKIGTGERQAEKWKRADGKRGAADGIDAFMLDTTGLAS